MACPGVEHRLRHQGRPADQAGQDARLVAERMEERVHHQIPVTRGQQRAVRPRPRHGQGPLVRGHRALAAPGRARGEHDVADVTRPHRPRPPAGLSQHRPPPCPRSEPARTNASHSPRYPHHQPEPVQIAGPGTGRPPQRPQPVHPEELTVHEQHRGPAARDHVQRLGPGEPGADRHQYPARTQRAQRGQHPPNAVGCPQRHPVPGRQAALDQRTGHRRHPLVQFAVTEPGPARLGQRLRVAELPSRPRHRGRDRQLHRRAQEPS